MRLSHYNLIPRCCLAFTMIITLPKFQIVLLYNVNLCFFDIFIKNLSKPINILSFNYVPYNKKDRKKVYNPIDLFSFPSDNLQKRIGNKPEGDSFCDTYC